MKPLGRNIAAVVGIDHYRHGIPRLRNACRDAKKLAHILEEEHDYDVLRFTEDVTRDRLESLFSDRLKEEVEDGDRLLVYFAGHGLAEPDETGLTGYLIPEDARLGPERTASFLSMDLLWRYLGDLPCHHLLVILDCCFAGAVRWSFTRDSDFFLPEQVTNELYQRYLRQPVTQVLASAAHDQRAYDDLWGLGQRGEDEGHSPFARALFNGLAGEADLVPRDGGDGLVTAQELYTYLSERVERLTLERDRQTPVLLTTRGYGKSQYVFEVPGRDVALPAAPPLDAEANPYRGLAPFEERHEELFFGRTEIVRTLREAVKRRPLTVVVGPSGTGKSSLVRAGLLPSLTRDLDWKVVGPLRPTARPWSALAEAMRQAKIPWPATPGTLPDELKRWLASHTETLLLCVDQLEELVTQVADDTSRNTFLRFLAKALQLDSERLRVVVTVRSDFEPHFAKDQDPLASLWNDGRLIVSPLTHDQLRQAILGPASLRVLFFEDGLVEQLVEEVLQEPGALPLLSFTLSQLYERYLKSDRTNRQLTLEDLKSLGGVAGALRERAEQEFRESGGGSGTAQKTLRRLMLRMVALQGGEPTRRRVPRYELVSPDDAENRRLDEVLRRLESARLVVSDLEPDGQPYVEPAHDKLITAWGRLRLWLDEKNTDLPLQRWVAQTSHHWVSRLRPANLLTPDDPRILQLRKIAKDSDNWLSVRELEFVQASHDARVAAQRRQRQRRRRFTTAVVLAALVTVIAAWRWVDLKNQSMAQNLSLVGQGLQSSAANQVQKGLQVAASSLAARPSAHATQAVIRGNQSLLPILDAFEHDRGTAVGAAAFSPDGRLVATGGYSGWLQLSQVEGGRVLTTLDLDSRIRAISFHPEGRFLAASTHEGLELLSVEIRDADASLERLGRAPFEEWSLTTAFLSAGAEIVVGGMGNHLRRFQVAGADLEDWPTTAEVYLDEAIFKLATSASGDVLAVGTQGLAKLFSGPSLIETAQLEVEDRMFLSAVALSPDGRLAATGDRRGQILLWDLEERLLLRQTEMDGLILDLVFSPDGQLLGAASQDRTARLWEVATLRPAGTVIYPDFITELAFSPDGNELLTAGNDGWVRTWNATAAAERWRRAGSSLTVSPDRMTVAIGHQKSIELFSATDGRQVLSKSTDFRFNRLALSPDGSRLFAWGKSSTRVGLWHLRPEDPDASEQRVLQHENEPGSIGQVSAFTPGPGAGFAVSGTRLGSARVWDLATQQHLLLPQHDGWVHVVATNETTREVLTAAKDGEVRIWDLTRCRETGRLTLGDAVFTVGLGHQRLFAQKGTSHQACLCRIVRDGESPEAPMPLEISACGGSLERLTSKAAAGTCNALGDLSCLSLDLGSSARRLAAFSPTDEVFAVVEGLRSGDSAVELRDGTGGGVLARLPHADTVHDLTFSADGAFLATASRDRHARIWRTADGTEVARIPHPAEVRKVAWADASSDLLATQADDGQVRLWPWRPADLVREACRRLTLGMPAEERIRVGKVMTLRDLCKAPS